MNKVAAILSLLTICSTAFSSVGDNLRTEKAATYKIKEVICAAGTLDHFKANQLASQVSNSYFIADTEARGGVLQRSGDLITEVIVISGAKNGICDNDGLPTMLIKIHQKVVE